MTLAILPNWLGDIVMVGPALRHLRARGPVTAVVYSHSHADHFGGVHGVVDEADVRSGKVKAIAPVGFMDHAVSENVYAGNAMSRRLFYTSTAYCCRPAPSATSISPSARTPPRAISG